MESKLIKQAITKQSLHRTLFQWCRDGGGNKNQSIKILSAFVSGKGIRAITPLIDNFLADGNNIEIIFGIDRGGTDRDAIRHLYFLQNAHGDQLTVNYFQARASGSIFHPKLYIYERNNRVNFVLGSANLTAGGLGSNLESLILFENLNKNSLLADQALEIWNSFANPAPPLPANSLNQLTAENIAKIIEQIPRQSNQEQGEAVKNTSDLWHPLSRIVLPKREQTFSPRPRIIPRAIGKFLVMDILKETRETQMQLPLPIVENFFGVQRNQPANLNIRIINDGRFTNPVERNLVISGQMRRLEMPQIRNLVRPLIVIFIKLPGQFNFAYYLVRHNSSQYRILNTILRRNGQQGNAERRFYISGQNDNHSPIINRLLGLI